ncbi:MAG: carboxypeptidase-like regulatory domain-containing protein, partial [Chitinophagaceae bacterium]
MRKKNVRQKTIRLLSLLVLVQLCSFVASAQVKISGRVTGRNGAGVRDITVQVKNTQQGTITDGDGNYTISATLPQGPQVLSFSGVGFKTREMPFTIGQDQTYSVNTEMETDALGLEEVVVTGTSLGTTKKQLGSFIATVKGDVLTKSAPPNVLAGLQGKTPGAQIIQNSGDPGGGMSVRLRGTSTISSSSEPLYIIDGVIVSNSARRVTNTQSDYDGLISVAPNRLVDINPADVERIEVLNGAAAA